MVGSRSVEEATQGVRFPDAARLSPQRRERAMQATKHMHAIVRRKYGTPDVLAYEEIERPVPGDEDVLVRVHAAGASIGDHIVVTGKPYLIRLTPFGGIPRPRNRVPGACMAGRVEAVGPPRESRT